MKGLRVRIDDEKQLTFATLWITACINLHCFAMDHEKGTHMEKTSFYQQGVRYEKERQRKEQWWRRLRRRWNRRREQRRQSIDEDIELLEGKVKREILKEELIDYQRQARM